MKTHLLLSLSVAWMGSHVFGQQDAAEKKVAAFSSVQQKGFEFLMKNQEGGRFFMLMPGRGGGKPQKHFDVGLTGLALAALQSKPKASRSKAEQAVIDKGLAWLLTQQDEDKGYFGRRTVVYATSSVVFALVKAERPEFAKSIERAKRFLQVLQNTEGRKYSPTDVDYGSYGYGNNERGDLSNTNFAIQAMREAGLDESDEALAKAIVFLQRLQNLRVVNKFEQKTKDPDSGKPIKLVSGDDGGATYYPGDSPAGFQDLMDGSRVPRSYGSMTYALLKTYTLCGIDKDDKRVQAAFRWVQKNWTVDTNPGADPKLGEKARYQGLFYYYMVMAQALDLVGADALSVKKAKGEIPVVVKVDWRKELGAKLASLQAKDGSWRNEKNDRWYEGVDVICSAYAMLALEHCR